MTTEEIKAPLDLDPRLVFLSHDPLNAELPLTEQHGVITPNHLFYLRNRFSQPDIDLERWMLTVTGAVTQEVTLRYVDLLRMPERTLTVTLECAGNGRSSFHPPADGEPWQFGAVSTAEWTGVPLHAVLERAGLIPETVEIVAYGQDGGAVSGVEGRIPFARSLPLDKALHPDTLLVYAMNGEPLPRTHGFPLRLIVPGWYGMASVKWLVRLEAATQPFRGFFQYDRYILPPLQGEPEPRPLRNTSVRSVILAPAPGSTILAGPCRIRGLAWSGVAPVTKIECSTNGGQSWHAATWTSPEEPYAWRGWEYHWQAEPGEHTLCARAEDAAGNVQPTEAEWNLLGYANNALHTVPVSVIADGR